MSDATTTWNAQDVQAFKEAFGARNSFKWPLSSEPEYKPFPGFIRARSMLLKRQGYAQQTLSAVLKKQAPVFGADNALLKGLQKMDAELSARTQEQVSQKPTGNFNAATQRMIDLTDEWIAFEARCISANNEMATGQSDAGVRSKLADRANGLAITLEGLRRADLSLDLGSLEQSVRALVNEAKNYGRGIANPAAFAQKIDACTKQLREAADSLTQSLEADIEPVTGKMFDDSYKKWKDIQELQLKQLYGINVKTTPIFGFQPGPFPYKDLLDVLAMVPADHSLTAALTTVTREYVALDEGGDYSDTTKTIRINPVLEWVPSFLDTGYKDPATGKPTRIDTWKATALHEIGHAVDAAYGIMKAHKDKSGCGTWKERSPADFLQPQYSTFLDAMRKSRVADTAFQNNVTRAEFKAIFSQAALGNKAANQLKNKIENAWTLVYMDTDAKPFNARASALTSETLPAIGQLSKALNNAFPKGRAASDTESARKAFLGSGSVQSDLAAISIKPSVIKPDEFWKRFDELAGNPSKPAQELIKWLYDQQRVLANSIDQEKSNDRTDKVTRWTQATIRALPSPANLKVLDKYREAAEPWNRDISGEAINGVAAAHEGSKGENWWQYSGDDRKSTFVSNYQWRAPAEWFAELYAVTWFKKVEPPRGVAREVRPYLFGGHITPDQAV